MSGQSQSSKGRQPKRNGAKSKSVKPNSKRPNANKSNGNKRNGKTLEDSSSSFDIEYYGPEEFGHDLENIKELTSTLAVKFKKATPLFALRHLMELDLSKHFPALEHDDENEYCYRLSTLTAERIAKYLPKWLRDEITCNGSRLEQYFTYPVMIEELTYHSKKRKLYNITGGPLDITNVHQRPQEPFSEYFSRFLEDTNQVQTLNQAKLVAFISGIKKGGFGAEIDYLDSMDTPVVANVIQNARSNNPKSFAAALRQLAEQLDHQAQTKKALCREPTNDKDALASEERDAWLAAFRLELDRLQELGVLSPTYQSPQKAKPIGCRWIYKLEPGRKGMPTQYKVQLVAKGNQQKNASNDVNTSELVPIEFVRLMFAVAHRNNFQVRHITIPDPFCNVESNETVYLERPPGSPITDDYLKLHKAIPGLKGVQQTWTKMLDATLTSLGFSKINDAGSSYIKRNGRSRCILIVYVSDIVIFGSSKKEIDAVSSALNAKYKIQNHGRPSEYSGLTFKQNNKNGALSISCRKTITHLLATFSDVIAEADDLSALPISATDTQHATSIENALNRDQEPPSVNSSTASNLLDNHMASRYRSAVGSSNYIASRTRPDLSYAASQLSRHSKNPRFIHWKMLQRALKYLQKTKTQTISFDPKSNAVLSAHSSATFTGDEVAYPHIGFIWYYGGMPVLWEAHREKRKCSDLNELEVRSLAETMGAGRWSMRVLSKIGEKPEKRSTYVFTDSGREFVEQRITNSTASTIPPASSFIDNISENYNINVDSLQGKSNHAWYLTKGLNENDLRLCQAALSRNKTPEIVELLNDLTLD